jgi:hypothetical protein
MLVHAPSRIGIHTSSMPTDMFASLVTGGKSSGCEKGDGVGVGVDVGVGVGGGIVGVAVAVAVAVGVGVGLAVAVGVGATTRN